jgi:hypothetical protein
LLCKNITVAKPKKVKRESNLAEFSEEGYGSKSAVLPMMMMMNLVVKNVFTFTKDKGTYLGEKYTSRHYYI